MTKLRKTSVLLLSFLLCSCHDQDYVLSTPSEELVDKKVSLLEIATLPKKTSYYEGEYFNRSGLKLLATFEDGTTYQPLNTEITISSHECLTLETNYVLASYLNASVEIPIEVKELELESLSVLSLPYTTTYAIGGNFAFQGLVIKGKVKDGDEKEISLDEVSFSIEGNAVHDQDEISLSAGAYKVVIDAYHQQASFDIQIVNGYKIEAENILFTSTTSKNDYVRIRNEEDEAYITQNNSNGRIRPISDETALLASGTSYLGDIQSGNIIDFYFYSAIETQADIAIRASSGYLTYGDGWSPKMMSDEQVNRLFDAYANGEKITIDDDVILPGKGDKDNEVDMSLWVNWQTVSFGLMSLQEGWNTISLKITSDYVNYLGYGCSFNLDYLSVNFVE
jgi:hypothetical protein